MSTNFPEKVGNFGAFLMWCGIIATVGILSYQGYSSWKHGEWQSIPLYKALHFLGADLYGVTTLEWEGVQKFLYWLLELPLAVVVAVLSIGIGYILVIYSEKKIINYDLKRTKTE